MKRISILVLLVCCVGIHIVDAQDDIPVVSTLRYSMYAFGHKSTGLVPSSVHYSPYAFGAHQSGLIPDTVRYSPYVFSAKHNGLISEIGATFIPAGTWDGVYGVHKDRQLDRLTQSINTLSEAIKHTKQPAYKTSSSYLKPAGYAKFRQPDPRMIAKAYLDTMIPGRYQFQHSLRIDNEIVSFDIVIADMNLVIKYWNPTKCKDLQEASNYKTLILSNYLKSWATAGNKYEATGHTVVHITPISDRQVIARLTETLETGAT